MTRRSSAKGFVPACHIPDSNDPSWPIVALPIAVFLRISRTTRELAAHFRAIGMVETLGMNCVSWLENQAYVDSRGERWRLTDHGRRWCDWEEARIRARLVAQ